MQGRKEDNNNNSNNNKCYNLHDFVINYKAQFEMRPQQHYHSYVPTRIKGSATVLDIFP